MITLPAVVRTFLAEARQRLGQAAPLNLVAGLVFGLFVFHCIENYPVDHNDYNTLVAQKVFMTTSFLLLLHLVRGRKLTMDPPLALALALLAAVALAASQASPSAGQSYLRLGFYASLAMFGTAIYLLHRNRTDGAAGAYLLAIGLVHLLVISILMLWLYSEHQGIYDNAYRLPFHANRRHFGYLGYLGAACGTALYFIRPQYAFTALLLTIPALFGIILFGSRGGLYAWFLLVGVLVVFSRRKTRLLIFAVAAAALAAGLCYFLIESGWIWAESLFYRVQATPDAIYRPSGRLLQWRDAFEAFKQQPWLGFGAEGYRASGCCVGGEGRYLRGTAQPHNFVLQFLLEFGLLGCAALGGVVALLTRSFATPRLWWSGLRSSPDLAALFSVLMGLMVYATVDGTLYHAIPLLNFAALTGLLFACAGALRQSSP